MRRTKGEREELSSGRGEFGFFKNRGGGRKEERGKIKKGFNSWIVYKQFVREDFEFIREEKYFWKHRFEWMEF